MHVKNADLQVSYDAPVRVSTVVFCVFVAARDKITPDDAPFCGAGVRFTTVPWVRGPFVSGFAVPRFVVLRSEFTTVERSVATRSVVGVVEILFCVDVRCVTLPSRTAACATDIAIAITKIRIFFISDEIVSKIAISGQAKYRVICDFYSYFWVVFSDFLVAKRFVLRYYAQRFTIVGQFVDRAYGGIGRRASFRY